MIKIREVIAYKHYFIDFLVSQPPNVQDKIYKIIELIEFQQRIPDRYIKHIEGTKGLYEARISLGNNIWRVFCFFDKGRLVVLLNGYQKKSKKTSKREIIKAQLLMVEYFTKKNNENGKK